MASQPIDQRLVWTYSASISEIPRSDPTEERGIKLVKERALTVISDSAIFQLTRNAIKKETFISPSMRALIHTDFPELLRIAETSVEWRRMSFLGERVIRLQSIEADGQNTLQKHLGNADLNSVVNYETAPLDNGAMTKGKYRPNYQNLFGDDPRDGCRIRTQTALGGAMD
jgi:hypothetical protein